MTDGAPQSWTTSSLGEALRSPDLADEFAVELIDGAESVLRVSMPRHGDLSIFLSVAGEQIVVSTLLWPVDEQPDADAFNRFILKAQKLVPLSNFAITEVDGRDYYELIGELAIESPLSAITLELRVLAENAIDAAGDLRAEFAA
ncbi:YjfI family protein [uncultured Sphingomonas sp.]|uniref:YjfI family protein n=1 Tax=uncultured Sphingomonas sp. TaxID=158754 RepID=UPI0035CB854A